MSETAMNEHELVADIVRRVAVGPHMSKDITRAEARDGMLAILQQPDLDPVRAALMLVGLRIKRETDEENRGIFDALDQCTQHVAVDVPVLVTHVDPYDGFARHLPATPFVPAALAACGLPTLSHGVPTMGPKYGVTAFDVLQLAGADVQRTPRARRSILLINQSAGASVPKRNSRPNSGTCKIYAGAC